MNEQAKLKKCSKLRDSLKVYHLLGEDGSMFDVLDSYIEDSYSHNDLIDCFLIVYEEYVRAHDTYEEDGHYIISIFYSHYVEKLSEEKSNYFWKKFSKTFENNLNSKSISHFLAYDILGHYFGNAPYSIMMNCLTITAAKEQLKYLRENSY